MKIDRQAILLSQGYKFVASAEFSRNVGNAQLSPFVSLSRGWSVEASMAIDRKTVKKIDEEARCIALLVISRAKESDRCFCHEPEEYNGHATVCDICRRAFEWSGRRARKSLEKHAAEMSIDNEAKADAVRLIFRTNKKARDVYLNIGRSLICAKQLAKACNQSTTATSPRKSTRL